ncbi:MAG TPA: hypothetical protein VFR37_12495, partial [Longimicrobium sp.]|nr:hypothetical protein [Longimicrobium sp.]
MILLLSQDSWETTTEEVQDWIEALGGDSLRLNGEDLNGDEPFAMRFDSAGDGMAIRIGGRDVRAHEVGAVWMRRWHTYRNLPSPEGTDGGGGDVRKHLVEELRAATRALEVLLGEARWLARLGDRRVNKLEMLRLAARAGLQVPATLVTNDRAELQAFRDLHGRIITKPLAEGKMFTVGEDTFPMYTAEVTQADIDRAPPRFFPSLAQAMVEKEVEIRTFYLAGECHSMAIFSQGDRQTELDFRRYNRVRPNRNVPYRLPDEVEAAVRRFMESVPLQTGSLDLIRTRGGEHVFLEVNPAGQ